MKSLQSFFSKPAHQILVLAVFLRLFLLSRVPLSLNWDEISMGYTAYSVSQTGRDEWGQQLPIFFRSYGEWKSAVYIYLVVPLVKFFGMNAWTVRLPSALAGILAVYLTYLIGRKLYGEKAGLWASLLLAISPWHLVLSRPAFEANVSLTLILAGVYYFLKYFDSHQLRALSLSAIFFGLAPHTYNSAKVVVPFLILYLVWQSKLFKNMKHLTLYFGILALFAAPIAVNLMTGRAQFRYTQVGISTNQTDIDQILSYRSNPYIPKSVSRLVFNKYTYSAHQFAVNSLTYVSPAFLLAEAGDHHQHHVQYFGVLYLAEYLFLLYGAFILIVRDGGKQLKLNTAFGTIPFVIIVLGIIPAALTRDQGHVLRSILTLPGWQLLAGVGLVAFPKTVWKKLLIGLLVLQAVVFMFAYFFWYPVAFARDWQYGYREVASYVQAHENEYDHIVVTKWYGEGQLFFAFYNKWDPLWYIGENKPNLVYESQGKLWLDQLEKYSIGKYEFKYIDWVNEKKDGHTLYIGKPDDFWPDSNYVEKINFPDGTPAFYLVSD